MIVLLLHASILLTSAVMALVHCARGLPEDRTSVSGVLKFYGLVDGQLGKAMRSMTEYRQSLEVYTEKITARGVNRVLQKWRDGTFKQRHFRLRVVWDASVDQFPLEMIESELLEGLDWKILPSRHLKFLSNAREEDSDMYRGYQLLKLHRRAVRKLRRRVKRIKRQMHRIDAVKGRGQLEMFRGNLTEMRDQLEESREAKEDCRLKLISLEQEEPRVACYEIVYDGDTPNPDDLHLAYVTFSYKMDPDTGMSRNIVSITTR